MEQINNHISRYKSSIRNFIFPYLFCLAIIIGPAYNMYVHYDFSHSIDTESYLAMSIDNFTVNPVHRYRIIIPILAKITAIPIKLVYIKLWPHRAESLWPLQLSYFIVNSFLSALYGWVVYKLIRLYSNHLFAILIGLTAILTSRWMTYIAGLPLTDSLYLVVIVTLLYSIKTRNTILYSLVVLTGALSKESFLLFIPFLLIAGPFNWFKQTFLILGGTLILLGEHYLIDYIYPVQKIVTSIKHENLLEILIRHSAEIKITITDLLSIRGLGELFTVLGIFSFVIIYGFIQSDSRKFLLINIEKYYSIFFMCIVLHALLSGDVARMFYFGSALYALIITLVIEQSKSSKSVS